jgi:uncharacterized protein (TIGR00661 family)
MKILYAIQATGNGHISRAKEILPLLEKHGDVDILISGTQADLNLPQTVKFSHHGFSFIFGKKGGVNHWETWKTMDLPLFIRNVKDLPLKNYNLVINDFEPVTAWACKIKKIESVGLSHQASFQSSLVPKPKSIDWAQLILKHYAPASHYIGFHFLKYDDFIHTPVIRSEIRKLITTNLGHYTVYLPAIEEKVLLPILKQVPVQWQVFSKHAKHSYTDENVKISVVNNEEFNASLASCAGLLTGGGFESPAEALFLGKKLLVAPMKFQYEQQCNAFALKKLGFPVLWGSNQNWLPMIKQWVNNSQTHALEFPDETENLVSRIVSQFAK